MTKAMWNPNLFPKSSPKVGKQILSPRFVPPKNFSNFSNFVPPRPDFLGGQRDSVLEFSGWLEFGTPIVVFLLADDQLEKHQLHWNARPDLYIYIYTYLLIQHFFLHTKDFCRLERMNIGSLRTIRNMSAEENSANILKSNEHVAFLGPFFS